VYDNPATWRREAWQDEKLLCDVAAEVLLQKGFNGGPDFPWILNCGPWQEGYASCKRDWDDWERAKERGSKRVSSPQEPSNG
jgi:hypothetical protein